MTASDGPPRTNALTFDLEHWHSATLLNSDIEKPTDHIEESVDIVLSVLREHDVTATFFVVGTLAEEYPGVVERIWSEGHEIGSHGHTHTPLFELTPDQFEAELERSSAAIERAIGVEPVGFRAPNFSITRKTEWAFDVLESTGYVYDSSVFPTKTPMYGLSDAPTRPYSLESADPFRVVSNGRNRRSLVEYPLAVIGSLVRLPIAGGFYARVLPERILEWGIRRLNRNGVPANLYFHPWEFNTAIHPESLKPHARFISFYGVERLEAKLDGLLTAFNFNTVRSVLTEEALLDPDGRRRLDRPSEATDLK